MNPRFPAVKTTFGQKIFLIAFGIVLSLFLLEAGLRCAGFIFSSWQDHKNKIRASRQGAYRIMCLGESTTALGDSDSYPSQLETVLNVRQKEIKFSVINEGVPGIDTTGIIERLDKNLNTYKPQMVIAMMGVNDGDWNRSEVLGSYQDEGGLERFLVSLRTYKLAKWIRSGISAKIKKWKKRTDFPGGSLGSSPSGKSVQSDLDLAVTYQRSGQYEDVQRILKKAMADRPLSYDETMLLAWSYECQSRESEAVKFFKKALELDDNSGEPYFGLGQAYFYMHDLSGAEYMFERLLQIDPGHDKGYIFLGQCYVLDGKFAEAEKTYLRAVAAHATNDRAYGALGLLYEDSGRKESASAYFKKANSLRSEYYYPSTKKNYEALKKALAKRDIKLVCVQYPMRNVDPLKKIYQGEEGILFVDNEEVFKSRVRKEGYRAYFTDLFAGDFGHCTPKGNKLLAENIADAILKELS